MHLSHRSPRTEVRESPIHGSGLFAREPIAAGEIVAVKGGHVLTGEQWRQLEPELGSAEVQIADLAPGARCRILAGIELAGRAALQSAWSAVEAARHVA